MMIPKKDIHHICHLLAFVSLYKSNGLKEF
jgi:hypothetical protein